MKCNNCSESEILDKLTPNLRAEVTHFAHKDTVKLLKGLKLFDALEESLLTRLIVALTTEFMPPDELVVAEGELGDVLYIIRKGVVSVCLLDISVQLQPCFCPVKLASVSNTILNESNTGADQHARKVGKHCAWKREEHAGDKGRCPTSSFD